jgi:hypothetical protein
MASDRFVENCATKPWQRAPDVLTSYDKIDRCVIASATDASCQAAPKHVPGRIRLT